MVRVTDFHQNGPGSIPTEGDFFFTFKTHKQKYNYIMIVIEIYSCRVDIGHD